MSLQKQNTASYRAEAYQDTLRLRGGYTLKETLPKSSCEVDYWDQIAEVWDQAPSGALWRRHCDAVNTRLLQRWLPDPALPVDQALKTDLFEEAFGEGLYPLLRSRARNVWGVDVSPHTVRLAQERCGDGLQGISADVRRLPFADNSFDVVVSTSTLDHFDTLTDVAAGLRELRRVLRPTGELLLTLDNLSNPVVATRNALPIRWLNRTGVVPYYVGATCGLGQLTRLLRETGFLIREQEAVMHCPRVFAVALAHRIERRQASPATQESFLRVLTAFERLSVFPTGFWTGHFLAIRATVGAEPAVSP